MGESCTLYHDVTTYRSVWQFNSMPCFVFYVKVSGKTRAVYIDHFMQHEEQSVIVSNHTRDGMEESVETK